MIAIAMVLFIVGLLLLALWATSPPVTHGDADLLRRVKLFYGILAICIATALALISPAHAAERPRLGPGGCEVVADMVIVARSLSEAGVERAQASTIMRLVYAVTADGGAIDQIREDIINLAYRRKEPPIALSRAVGESCIEHRGLLDQVLGSPVGYRGTQVPPLPPPVRWRF